MAQTLSIHLYNRDTSFKWGAQITFDKVLVVSLQVSS